MKKALLFTIALAGLFFAQIGTMNAQCIVDPQYTAPGIYPNDTLQDMMATVATNQVVQFVFPADTVVLGFTLPFDSFVVNSVNNIPSNLQWECNNNHPTCVYVTTPGQLTRGCVTIFDVPQVSNPAYPGYDSIIVTGVAWVTFPFGGAQSLATDIPVYYRIQPFNAVQGGAYSTLDLNISPNPVAYRSNATFNLETAANVKLTVIDMLGKEVKVLSNQMMNQGTHEVKLDVSSIEAGAYFVKIDVNNGEFVQSKKFMTIR